MTSKVLRVECDFKITENNYKKYILQFENLIERLKNTFGKRYIYIAVQKNKCAHITLVPYDKELDYLLTGYHELFTVEEDTHAYINEDIYENIDKLVRDNQFRNILNMTEYRYTDVDIIEDGSVLSLEVIKRKLSIASQIDDVRAFFTK